MYLLAGTNFRRCDEVCDMHTLCVKMLLYNQSQHYLDNPALYLIMSFDLKLCLDAKSLIVISDNIEVVYSVKSVQFLRCPVSATVIQLIEVQQFVMISKDLMM